MKKFGVFLSVILLSLFMGNVTAAEAKTPGPEQKPAELEVHYIDVGQGDATLIKCGDAAMLIDAGENDKGTLIQNYLRKQGVETLDYLIITHPDSDHAGGADVIITKYDIDTIIYPNYAKDTATWRDVVKAMDYRRYKVTEPVVGDTYRLGDAEFSIIAPVSEDYGDNANNYSVGILLRHGNNKFLWTGDAEEEAENDIAANSTDLKADVLKVGHHGSRTATSDLFLETVDPVFAVISCGENNSYGHPHAAALNKLRARNVKLFRTDEQGSLIASSDGTKITWNAAPAETWKAGEPSGSGTDTDGKTAVSGGKKSAAAEEINTETQQNKKSVSYILNSKTKKFHTPNCGSLPTTNRKDTDLGREELIAKGYQPCKKCGP